MYFLSAVLASFFLQRTREAEVEILTRCMQRTVSAGAVPGVNPGSVAFTTEQVRFGECLTLIPIFLFLKLFHPSANDECYGHDSTLMCVQAVRVCINRMSKRKGTDGRRCRTIPVAGMGEASRSRTERWSAGSAGPIAS